MHWLSHKNGAIFIAPFFLPMFRFLFQLCDTLPIRGDQEDLFMLAAYKHNYRPLQV
jgi:hypothetical protein